METDLRVAALTLLNISLNKWLGQSCQARHSSAEFSTWRLKACRLLPTLQFLRTLRQLNKVYPQLCSIFPIFCPVYVALRPREKKKSWQSERDLAENRRKRKNSIGFWLIERGNSGCSWPSDMAKENVWPYTHIGLWSKKKICSLTFDSGSYVLEWVSN